MNDADRKAFDMWWEYGKGNHGEQFDAWRAACEWCDSQNQQLIEALRLLVSIYDQNITGHLVEDAFNKAREIIAKSKGEQTK